MHGGGKDLRFLPKNFPGPTSNALFLKTGISGKDI
jgi:hypothetical protein